MIRKLHNKTLKRKARTWILGQKRKVIDWLDSGYLRLIKKKGIPPYTFRVRIGEIEQYEQRTAEFIAYFRLLCGLKMNHNILDIGCGPGRFASQLSWSENFCGEYYGFDVDKRAIDWANSNIAKHKQNIEFKFVDLRNSLYNPHGKVRADTFSFPYSDEKFDFVFAYSVFTHILPHVASNYLLQISRVLKPGGKALVTFLLLDGYPKTISQISQKYWKKILLRLDATGEWYHRGIYSIIHPRASEIAVAYQESAVKKMIEQSNLHLEKIYYGSWNGLQDYLSLQDIVIVHKRKSK